MRCSGPHFRTQNRYALLLEMLLAAGMKPLALSVGDPSGVGPELAAAAWRGREENAVPPFFLLADPALVAARARLVGLDVPIRECAPAEAAAVFKNALPVAPLAHRMGDTPGISSVTNAAGVIEAIDRAVDAVRDGAASAVVTAPIAKKTLYDAGFRFPGHTEYLGHLSATRFGVAATPVMMIAGPDLRTVPLTIHIALSAVPAAITREAIPTTCRIVAADLTRRFGLAKPRPAVAGPKPPARGGRPQGARGIDARGPLPADTMFHARARAGYDVAICMYHDQALIPAKTLAFDSAVNVTLGLPFIRTSPDHGTAFDIAGKGVARPDSLIAALKMAGEMAARETA